MANEVTISGSNFPAFAMSEEDLIGVLERSLYPGANKNSIKMVVGYCRAAGLDPLKKPVHIVPMWDSKANELRDVIMPGIGNYRTDAARSGQYAGVTDPEFGEDVTENIGGVMITYPKSCRVVVKRLLHNGTVAEFSAVERWKENYAMKGGKEKSIAPNSMWIKRPYAQLAKCAEAQALRKAFPECGAAPTADEMEGKEIEIDGNVIDGTATTIRQPQRKQHDVPPEEAGKHDEKPAAAEEPEKKAEAGDNPALLEKLPASQMKVLRAKMEAATISEADVEKKLGKKFEELTKGDWNAVLSFIANPMG